jgi:predicted nucleotide-binding protein
MNKLLVEFKLNSTEANKIKLQKYITKHPFSVCLLMPDDVQFLKQHNINVL